MRRPPSAPQLSALELAISEFLEEGYVYQVNQHEIAETEPDLRDDYLRAMLPERTQAEGCFVWIRYLVWLDGIREFAGTLSLSADEAQGLSALHRARARFQRAHPPCSRCGMPNEETNFRCHACMAELRR